MAQAVESVLADVPKEQRPAVRWQLFSEIELSDGANFGELSLSGWDEDDEAGGEEVVFPGGYSDIVKHTARGLDVRLKQKVVSVDHTGDEVVVRTADDKRFAAVAVWSLCRWVSFRKGP